jgi:hypothetical protein
MPARAGPTSPLQRAARQPLRPWWVGLLVECADSPSLLRRGQRRPRSRRASRSSIWRVSTGGGNYGAPVLYVPQRPTYPVHCARSEVNPLCCLSPGDLCRCDVRHISKT